MNDRPISSLIPRHLHHLGLAALGTWVLVSCDPAPSAASSGSDPVPQSEVSVSAPSDTETQHTGTFTVDGKTYTGKVSTQLFPATGQYSVVCQDDDFGLVQITFHNESDARKPQGFQLVKTTATSANPAGTVNLSLQPFSGASLDSTNPGATVTVSADAGHHVISFTDAELFSVDEATKKPVSGKISF